MKAYKLLTLGHSHYCPSDGEVEYRIGETTVPRPGCGPLVAFKTIKSASQFYSSPGDICPLHKAIVRKSKSTHVWTPLGGKTSSLPSGSVLCDSVTLGERIR